MLQNLRNTNLKAILRPKWIFIASLIAFCCSLLLIGSLPIPEIDYLAMGVPIEIYNIYRVASILCLITWGVMFAMLGYVQGVNHFGVQLAEKEISND